MAANGRLAANQEQQADGGVETAATRAAIGMDGGVEVC